MTISTEGKLKIYLIYSTLLKKNPFKKEKRRIKIPDAIIAATTLLEDCTLITKNVADFSGIVPDEKVLDPSFN